MAANIKQAFGVVLRHGHPLARGLAGVWMFNEGRGDRACDLSGAGHTGTLTGMDPSSDWVGGPHGHALNFDGLDDRVIVGSDVGINLGTANACTIRFRLHALTTSDILVGHKTFNDGGYFLSLGSGDKVYYCANGTYTGVTHGIVAGDEVWLGVSREGTFVTFYKNGVPLGLPQTLGANNALTISAIGCYRTASDTYAVNMRCDYVYCWRRSLSAREMAWLYREPFCLIGWQVSLPIIGPPSGTTHNLSGSATAVSSLGATATVTVSSDLPTGRPWPEAALGIETSWQREVILNGVTDAAIKLATCLTQGWFWTRRSGCAAIYRGINVPDAASGPIVCVTEADARQVTLPTYLPHEPDSTSFYLLRRFHSCGHQDRTTDAVVCIRVGSDGQVVVPAPNAPLNLRAEPAAGNRVELTWLHYPLDQEVALQLFRVYGDGGIGDIDFVHPMASLPYDGHRFYRWQSQPLGAGRYLFAVRSESAAGTASPPQAVTSCEVRACSPDEPGILSVEAI